MSIHMLRSRDLEIRKYDDGAAEQYMDISEFFVKRFETVQFMA